MHFSSSGLWTYIAGWDTTFRNGATSHRSEFLTIIQVLFPRHQDWAQAILSVPPLDDCRLVQDKLGPSPRRLRMPIPERNKSTAGVPRAPWKPGDPAGLELKPSLGVEGGKPVR